MADDTGLQFKKFVTENEIEEKRKERQEEWDKVRKPDDPIEAPEEVIDNRCLFERLEEQRMKKQDEYDDQFKLSNQVKGLDDDEAQFLDEVSERQMTLDRMKRKEEKELLDEYKNAVSSQAVESGSSKSSDAKRPSVVQKIGAPQTKKSQKSLLAGVVKRKSSSEASAGPDKKSKNETEESGASSSKSSENTTERPTESTKSCHQTAQVIGILPGLGEYDAASDTTDSDSDFDPASETDVFSVRVKCGGDN